MMGSRKKPDDLYKSVSLFVREMENLTDTTLKDLTPKCIFSYDAYCLECYAANKPLIFYYKNIFTKENNFCDLLIFTCEMKFFQIRAYT